MSAAEEAGKPLLASLVQAGEGQSEAVAINDFIFMVKDISNAYLVRTGDGDVLINTGFMDNAARNKALFDAVRRGPLRRIVLTQAHADHFGGVPVLREPETQVIAERRFVDTARYFHELAPYLARRSRKLWAGAIKRSSAPPPPPEVAPDVVVDRRLSFEQGGRQFELISTPGGESLCSLTVWLPQARIAFTGNLFGPVFSAMPNLVTLRGDKPRLVQRYLRSLEAVRELGAELLITGHGEPIRGADHIRASLDRMHAAVSFVNRAVIDGMNAGKDVHALMREVQLPEALRIGEFHGKVAWAVRSIWEEYSGWFHYDSTTGLYGVPRRAVDADLAELAGGAPALAARARQKLEAGQPLEAMHLLDIALGATPTCGPALVAKKAVLHKLAQDAGNANLSETMWLRAETAAVDEALAALSPPAGGQGMNTAALIARAQKATGLSDLGDPKALEGLEVLVKASNEEARLSPAGAMRWQETLTGILINRLKIIDYLKKKPELLRRPVEKPLFVFGLPRTGTTLTINLLNADPMRRCLLRWEALQPVPPAKAGELSTDLRCGAQRQMLNAMLQIAPQIAAAHFEEADSPTECQYAMQLSFCAEMFDSILNIPSYSDWFLHRTGYRHAFEFHKQLLQVLQEHNGGRWTLKNPWHPLFLDDLKAVYPDAQLVMTHRDPAEVVGSACSLLRHVRPMYSDQMDLGEIRQTLLHTFDLMIERQDAYRAKHGRDSIHDIQYEAQLRDPVGTMRKLYAHFGETLSAEAEAGMTQLAHESPQHKHGKHVYSLAEFGLTAEGVLRHFRDYCERFEIPLKG